jgi:hypothetical protein
VAHKNLLIYHDHDHNAICITGGVLLLVHLLTGCSQDVVAFLDLQGQVTYASVLAANDWDRI